MNREFPLQWPAGWPRTGNVQSSKFGNRTVHAAIEQVLHEIKLMKGSDVTFSSNVALGNNAPKDKGVCVYFRLKGTEYALPCDKWNAVEDNIWALAKHIESLRLQERWGVGTIERAFAGYMSLPPPSKPHRPWWEVMNIPRETSAHYVVQEYKKLAKKLHPDTGGSHESFTELQRAFEEAKLEVK